MKNNILYFGLCVLVIVVVLGTVYGIWTMKRKFNYTFMYKSLVQETIREMVKPEYLK